MGVLELLCLMIVLVAVPVSHDILQVTPKLYTTAGRLALMITIVSNKWITQSLLFQTSWREHFLRPHQQEAYVTTRRKRRSLKWVRKGEHASGWVRIEDESKNFANMNTLKEAAPNRAISANSLGFLAWCRNNCDFWRLNSPSKIHMSFAIIKENDFVVNCKTRIIVI